MRFSGGVLEENVDDPNRFALTAGHVHLALRDILGLDPQLTARFPLTTVVPQQVLPILKLS
jgi:hypothetical protein